MLRSVLYWVAKSAEYSLAGTEGGGVARIYCIGTPFVWWLAAAGPSLFAAWLMTQVSAPLRAPTAPHPPRRTAPPPHPTAPHRTGGTICTLRALRSPSTLSARHHRWGGPPWGWAAS